MRMLPHMTSLINYFLTAYSHHKYLHFEDNSVSWSEGKSAKYSIANLSFSRPILYTADVGATIFLVKSPYT